MSWKFNKKDHLGKKVQNFILENSQYSLYLRKNPDFKCPNCWDLASKSAKLSLSFCSFCLGFGVKTDVELVPARLNFGRANPAFENTMPGLHHTNNNAICYFPRSVMPSIDDILLISEWSAPSQELQNAKDRKLIRVNSIYTIRQVDDHFERELSHFACSLELYPAIGSQINLLVANFKDLKIFRNHLEDFKQKGEWNV